MLCINIKESIRRKNVSKINLGSNKVCVVSLIIFFNFLKLCLFKSFSKKIIKKMKNANDQNFFNFVGGLDKGGGLAKG